MSPHLPPPPPPPTGPWRPIALGLGWLALLGVWLVPFLSALTDPQPLTTMADGRIGSSSWTMIVAGSIAGLSLLGLRLLLYGRLDGARDPRRDASGASRGRSIATLALLSLAGSLHALFGYWMLPTPLWILGIALPALAGAAYLLRPTGGGGGAE